VATTAGSRDKRRNQNSAEQKNRPNRAN